MCVCVCVCMLSYDVPIASLAFHCFWHLMSIAIHTYDSSGPSRQLHVSCSKQLRCALDAKSCGMFVHAPPSLLLYSTSGHSCWDGCSLRLVSEQLLSNCISIAPPKPHHRRVFQCQKSRPKFRACGPCSKA